MSYITTQNQTDWTADLAAVNAQIAALDAATLEAVSKGTRSYIFDAGKGRQQETFESPLLMIESRAKLTATRELLKRKLNGRAIVRSQHRP